MSPDLRWLFDRVEAEKVKHERATTAEVSSSYVEGWKDALNLVLDLIEDLDRIGQS